MVVSADRKQRPPDGLALALGEAARRQQPEARSRERTGAADQGEFGQGDVGSSPDGSSLRGAKGVGKGIAWR